MKHLLFILSFIIIAFTSLAQFSDTAQLNAYIKDTVKDRRPEKVTAAQIQKGLLGISKFLIPDAVSEQKLNDTLTYTFFAIDTAKQSIRTQIVNNNFWKLDGSNNLTPNTFPGTSLQLNKNLFIADSSFVAKGTFGTGAIPVQGAGARMMWYPRKAAFRAGSVSGSEWDDINIGNYSIALGKDNIARGFYSTAIGTWNEASGFYSFAAGTGNVATGTSSMTFGFTDTATGANSIALGTNTHAKGDFSIVFGSNTLAKGNFSTVFGMNNQARYEHQTVLGKHNDTTKRTVFEIGWGSSHSNRKNLYFLDTTGQSNYNVLANNEILTQWKDNSGSERLTLKSFGNSNLFIGTNIGNNVTGSSNLGLGISVFASGLSGVNNTGLGHLSLSSNTTGSYNTAVGYETGYNLTTGGTNTLIGYRAGYNLSGGAGNIFLGYNAGANATGSDQLYIANSNTSTPLIYGEFNNNILSLSAANGKFGIRTKGPEQALHVAGQIKIDTITTGSSTDSILTTVNGVVQKIAQTALSTYSFSTGLTNTANTITNNLSTGVTGGQTVTGGTASGNNLTLSSTTNSTKGKLLFGTSAYDEANNRLGLGTATPNQQLELTGNIRMVNTTTTGGATYKGTSLFIHNFNGAGANAGSAGSNTFIGLGTGNLTMTASGFTGALFNTGVGSGSLDGLTTGSSNTGAGYNALGGITSGSTNSALGMHALSAATTGTGNTVNGYSSFSNLTTGNYNTAIGFAAGGNSSGASSYNIIIGSGVSAPNTTGSRQLNIGNVIYGINMYDGGNVSSSSPISNGYIGIGTISPQQKLHVGGKVQIDDVPDGSNNDSSLVINEGVVKKIPVAYASGTYTPTLTNEVNTTSSSANSCTYIRIGSIVTVYGSFTIEPTAGGNTQIGISLPVASDLAAITDLNGLGKSAFNLNQIDNAIIQADITNNRATLSGEANSGGGATTVTFSFQYNIL